MNHTSQYILVGHTCWCRNPDAFLIQKNNSLHWSKHLKSKTPWPDNDSPEPTQLSREVHLSNPWHKKTILPSLGSLGLGNMGGHNKLRYWVTLRVKTSYQRSNHESKIWKSAYRGFLLEKDIYSMRAGVLSKNQTFLRQNHKITRQEGWNLLNYRNESIHYKRSFGLTSIIINHLIRATYISEN